MIQQSDLRTRREAVQRVQIGVAGFATVLLVVALANIISSGRTDKEQLVSGGTGNAAGGVETTTVIAPPIPKLPDSEPLADLGLTPKAEAPQVVQQAAPTGPAVPDLEPDPRLAKPMDQDPKRPQPQPTQQTGQRP